MRDHNVQLTTSAVGGDIALEQRARKRRAEQQAETSYMAQILDYIGQTADMYELHDNPRNWSDVEIMEMAAKRGRDLGRRKGFWSAARARSTATVGVRACQVIGARAGLGPATPQPTTRPHCASAACA